MSYIDIRRGRIERDDGAPLRDFLSDTWRMIDGGGTIYLADGRVIDRKPGQTTEDAITESDKKGAA